VPPASAAAAGTRSLASTPAIAPTLPAHPTRLEIDVRSSRLGMFTVSVPGDWSLASDFLDRAMEICNRYRGDPGKHIGGPELPEIKP
jgi:hypothetical protein